MTLGRFKQVAWLEAIGGVSNPLIPTHTAGALQQMLYSSSFKQCRESFFPATWVLLEEGGGIIHLAVHHKPA